MNLSARTSALLRHVDVTPIVSGSSTFIGKSIDLGWGRVYGGQTMAQALSASQRTVPADRDVHEFSCHFLRAGDVSEDVVFTANTLMEVSDSVMAKVKCVRC